jgi:hypothetical protein
VPIRLESSHLKPYLHIHRCSRHLALDEDGTAVAVDRNGDRIKNADDDDSDDSSEEDSSEASESEEESGSEEQEQLDDAQRPTAFPSGGAQSQVRFAAPVKEKELTRAERREMKKQKKTKGPMKSQSDGEEEEEEQEELLENPNHVMNKMKISDLGKEDGAGGSRGGGAGAGKPREMSRREREAKEKKEAQEKYWKVRPFVVSSYPSFNRIHLLTLLYPYFSHRRVYRMRVI